MNEIIYNFSQYNDGKLPLNVMIGGVSYCDHTYSISRVNADVLSFEYIIDGEGTLEINGETLHPKKGDVYLLTKNSNHRYYTTNIDSKATPWIKIWVVFFGGFAEQIFEQYIPKDLYLVEKCNISAYMHEIIALLKGGQEYHEKVDQVAIVLLKIAQKIRNHLEQSDKRDRTAYRIQQWINTNVNNMVKLDDISREFNYSKNQIINIFKFEYEVTPYQYYKQKRVDSAKQYLLDTNLSIKEISQIMNFPDRHYFANFFKENVGIYPTEFRNSL